MHLKKYKKIIKKNIAQSFILGILFSVLATSASWSRENEKVVDPQLRKKLLIRFDEKNVEEGGRILKFKAHSDFETIDMQGFFNDLKKSALKVSGLNFTKAKLYLHDITFLADKLKNNSSLRSLTLGHNFIEDDGVTRLADALKVNKTIQVLNLKGDNYIGPKGTQALVKMLEVNTTITSLNLKNNKLEDEGVRVFSQLLIRNKTLTYLNLGGNNISDKGIQFIAKMIEKNTTFTFLDLQNNQITEEGKNVIRESLKKKDKLTVVF